MKIKNLAFTLGVTAVLAVPLQIASAADKEMKPMAAEKTFIMKAANGGMMEVEAGKVAAEKGNSAEVKDFGNRMVKDHSKANDQLKDAASKMGVSIPDKLDAMHQAKVDKLSGMSGAAFDKGYVNAMVMDHKKDIAEFEAADKKVKNEDLKKFIEDTIPVMKDHLAMIEKFDQAKK